MATPQQIQDQIDLTQPSTRIVRSSFGAVTDEHYVVGGQAPYAGRSRWCPTTAAQTAAQQAAAILVVLLS